MSTAKNLFLLSAVVIVVLACFVNSAMAGTADGPGILYPPAGHIQSSFGHRPEAAITFGPADARILKVISLLEKKTDDPKVIERLRHKLAALGEKRLQMVSSLSDRILDHRHEAEADVAFLLVTALIVFS